MSERGYLLSDMFGGIFVGLIVSGIAYGVIWLLFSGDVAFVSFLIILPAASCAAAALIGDPGGTRGIRFYFSVPLLLIFAICALSVVALREGAVCIVMYAPIWIVSGEVGVFAAWHYRGLLNRRRDALCSVLIVLPFLAMQIEAQLPVPERRATVSRTIEIDAPAARVWPLLRGIPDVRPHEGRWNLTQDLLGVPRPRGAWLAGDGPGALRHARWAGDIAFNERITVWRPGREIGWHFEFGEMTGWNDVDRHLAPNGGTLRISDGGYRLTPLPVGRSRLELHTSYVMRTNVSAYARLFGEWFLGDIHGNLLTIVKDRAESAQSRLKNSKG